MQEKQKEQALEIIAVKCADTFMSKLYKRQCVKHICQISELKNKMNIDCASHTNARADLYGVNYQTDDFALTRNQLYSQILPLISLGAMNVTVDNC